MFEWLRSLELDVAAGRAVGEAQVPATDPLFADHFPGHPVLPGTVAVELAAQVAGPLVEEMVHRRWSLERWAVLGVIREAKMVRPVALPARLHLAATVGQLTTSRAEVQVTASQAGEARLRGRLLFALQEADADWAEAVAARRRRLERWTASRAES